MGRPLEVLPDGFTSMKGRSDDLDGRKKSELIGKGARLATTKREFVVTAG
jgi:hypothetical protein